jgi:hypothetical protein
MGFVQYILIFNSFSAALLGLPKLLKEDDIHAEYPSDTDDEYVTEKGFQPTLPGEFTKISSALALFRVSRILSKVLEQNYPAAATHDLSLQSFDTLETELNQWSDNLPQHLKLTFVQDKPSTDVTGSRSALLVCTVAWFPTHLPTDHALVACFLLHPIFDSSSRRWLYSWHQVVTVCPLSCRLEQAHYTNCAAPRGEEHVFLFLLEQE